ncbi:MAG: alpha/beta fold hydrolase [Burkholderiales bacterium]|nr:alpha/beta fold hydrolase [Burkholderiales bacterium]
MSAPQPLALIAADGQKLGAHRFAPAGETRAAIVIGPAMGVPASFYHRFAAFLAERGYAVTTFDYRGIGASLDAPLRGHPATLTDWFSLDYPAAIASARAALHGGPLYLLGHSLGGQIPGLLPDLAGIDGMLSIATGSGYWRETAPPIRNKYPLLAYLIGPLAMGVAGYFPGKRLRIIDDVPASAMRQWVSWCKHREYCAGIEPDAKARFARASFPVHTVSFTDDEFMTERSTEAMLAHYVAAPRRHTRVLPAQWNEKRIGHFGFFRKEMAAHWPRAVQYLDELPATGAWRKAA